MYRIIDSTGRCPLLCDFSVKILCHESLTVSVLPAIASASSLVLSPHSDVWGSLHNFLLCSLFVKTHNWRIGYLPGWQSWGENVCDLEVVGSVISLGP